MNLGDVPKAFTPRFDMDRVELTVHGSEGNLEDVLLVASFLATGAIAVTPCLFAGELLVLAFMAAPIPLALYTYLLDRHPQWFTRTTKARKLTLTQSHVTLGLDTVAMSEVIRVREARDDEARVVLRLEVRGQAEPLDIPISGHDGSSRDWLLKTLRRTRDAVADQELEDRVRAEAQAISDAAEEASEG